ncbi:DMT family transporter [Novosphingobium aquimarinum]|uniref:DMT family transporter n=1 Tax=Novosphingobium aquimarinum TaxID=2682494 RepID=UPI001E449EB6|nr:DMT family transporter [Novosphingobium aquimarinum]
MAQTERPILALGLRVCAMALIATMFMLIKVAGDRGIAGLEVIFWRQALSLPIIVTWLWARGGLSILRTRRMASHAQRAIFGMMALFCNVSAAMLLPLAEATTFGFTAPLFAVLLTPLILKDRVGPWRWAAVLLGFAGVLIIANPGHEVVAPLGVAAGLGAGFLVAVVSFQIRDLAQTEATITCVFWFAFFGAAMSAIVLPIYYTPHGAFDWALLVLIGICGTFGQLLLTSALRFGQVATVVVMDYTSLIWATLYGWLIWDLLPGIATWLGAPAIIAAGLIITWREHRLAKAVAPVTSQGASSGTA